MTTPARLQVLYITYEGVIAGRAYGNICQPKFELTGWVVGPTMTTFHGDLRETLEMLSPLLPSASERFLSAEM
jgi:hypothetical protein